MSSAPSARRTPVPQHAGDTQYNVRDAALLGASSAFSKPPVKPRPQVNTYTGGTNEALLAAAKVSTGNTRSTPGSSTTSPLRKDWTGGSHTGRPYLLSKSSSSSTLGVPDDLSERTPSPSNIAAKLAAARYSPMKPVPQPKFVPIPITGERDADDQDVLPPVGSVSNVLARLNSRSPGQQLRRKDSIGSRSAASTIRPPREDDRSTDNTPIPPTTSLVKMFEQNRPSTPTKQPVEPLTVSRNPPPQVRSPKPQRKFKLPPEPEDEAPLERRRTRTPPPPKPKPAHIRTLSMDGSEDTKSSSNARKTSTGAPPTKQKPAQLAAIKTAMPRLSPPSRRASRQARPESEDLTRSPTAGRRRFSTSISMDSNEATSSPTSFVSAREEQPEEKPKPSLPPPRRSTKSRTQSAHAEVRPKTPSVLPKPRTSSRMASPSQVPERFPRPAAIASSSPPSDSIYHSNYQRESVKQITKHMTGESLSNAIMGAALASSRNHSPAPSSTATPPAPSSRKHHQHYSPLHHNRSPSPPKSTPGKLRTTLRKEPSSSSDEDESERYKRKGTRIMGMRRKHPNKHHEGTRKRWRDTITERERKRYEGVWAANKGLDISSHYTSRTASSEDSALDVLNLVTRELWLRSRLPEHELEEVWDLVDGRGVGRLRREEFVVGMWLIDQRLKGRKIPVKVSESVWGSVKNPAGVKIRVK